MILHNFARAIVSIGYDASATSIALETGGGARFPSTFPFRAVWWDSTLYPNPSDDPNREIVEVTARSTDTLTIARGQETSAGGLAASTKNTAASIYRIALVPTAESVVAVGATHAATGKTTPVDADELSLFDSAASYVRKKLTWANLKATLKTYFDTLYGTAAQGALAATALQPTTWSALTGTTPALTFAAGRKAHTHTLSGDTTYSASAYAQGYRIDLFLTGDGSSRTLAFPSWTWLEGAPTALAASKHMQISLVCTGTTAASVFATYAVES